MTIKELAQFCGKNETTVQRWVKKTIMQNAELKLQNADFGNYGHDYSIDEVEQILLHSSMSKDAVNVIMQNARQNTLPKTSTLTERDIELISSIVSMTVAKTIEQLDKRMAKIEDKIEERQALLPVNKDSRANITELVRNYAANHNLQYNEVYSMLYREYGYRTHSNPTQSAKNRRLTTIEFIYQSGKISTLESIAIELLA